uniref:DNA-directed RNA polymerase subunit n=1 Tax=Tanacetum cinerariifolium TaxID=118510 RepID=A0A6L2LB75_TANCI|nr:DNA-directed RNA polymerase II subunit RPB7 [Tanacetum cinerariifolium]
MANDKISFYYNEDLRSPNSSYFEIGTSLPKSNIGASLKLGMETQVRYMESKEDEGIVEDQEISDEVGYCYSFYESQPHKSCELMEEISDLNQGRNQNIKSQGVSKEKQKILHEQSFEFPSSQPRQRCELMEEISYLNHGRNQNIKSLGASTKKRKILHEQSFEFQSSQPHQSCELMEEITTEPKHNVTRAKGIKQHNNSCFNHQESAMDAEFEDERKKKIKEAADLKHKEKKEEADMAAHFFYWESSQNFVFTCGWNRFVKEKKLMANDKISFYDNEDLRSPNSGCFEIGTSLPKSNIRASLKLGMETQVRYMESKEDEGVVEDREISDELHPHHFGRELREKLVSNLMKDVEGTCNGRDDFVVTITGIEDIGKGSIRDGTGFVTFPVKYSCFVFLPFKGEILEATVTTVNKMGFFVEAGLVQIFVSNHARKLRNIINVPYLRYQRECM